MSFTINGYTYRAGEPLRAEDRAPKPGARAAYAKRREELENEKWLLLANVNLTLLIASQNYTERFET